MKRGIIQEEEQEIYQFGIRNGVIILLNVITAFLIGLFTNRLLVVVIFTLFFMILRSYTGGYHSDSRVFCYMGSNLVLFIPVYTERLFMETSNIILTIIIALSVGIIMVLSPMHSKNRKLDKKEQKHFGKRARCIIILQLFILWILWSKELLSCAYAVYTSICITAVLMVIGKIQLWIESHMESTSPF